nr:hypothetical protein [Tanacetum cinerariifolium]
LIAGCASSPVSKVGASTKVAYYPSCYEPVQHLRDTDSDTTKSVIGGAAVGALGGALAGALHGVRQGVAVVLSERIHQAAFGAQGQDHGRHRRPQASG